MVLDQKLKNISPQSLESKNNQKSPENTKYNALNTFTS